MKAESKKKIQKAESTKLERSSFGLSALSFKLGYDGKRATNNLTGLGNYSRSLIEQIAIKFPSHQYFVYTPKAKDKIVSLALFQFPNVFLKFPNGFTLLWRSFGIKRQLQEDRIALFHGLSHEIPIGLKKIGIKSVVTIHDLIFLKRPQDYSFIDRFIYHQKAQYACNHADRIIAISQKTKNDIIEQYRIPDQKIEVIYQTCDEAFKCVVPEKQKESIAEKYQLPDQFILSVGTIEPRKNLLLLVRALAETQIPMPLVVIGKATAYFKEVQKEVARLQLQNRIIFLKNIPFADLPAIYQLAKLFVYPSFYEGFGIPIIEALYSKTPVIAATGSCLEEAGGPDSYYVHPKDHSDLAQKIDWIWSSSSVHQNMVENGYNYVQKFGGEQISKQLMNCYLRTLNK